MSAQVEKVIAHASHLLTEFIQLRERYALLHPMLFVEHVPKQYGSRKQARGFSILKSSLFLTCCQDIAKLLTDKHDNTPSIKNIMEKLRDGELRTRFRRKYVQGRTRVFDDDYSPAIAESFRQMALTEEPIHIAEFDRLYDEATRLWSALETSHVVKDFRTVRDKVTAHTEVRLHNDEYKPLDFGTLGIQWRDIKQTIDSMQQLVELIGRLTRDASFTWDHLDRLLTAAGDDFWQDRSAVILPQA